MPKLFVDSRQGTFTAEARLQIAAALTNLGIACERLADTPNVRAGVWVSFTEHTVDEMFSGGQVSEKSLVRLLVLALKDGLDEASKQRLIAVATNILIDHAAARADQLMVYVVILEVPEVSWGMNGKQVSLAALRAAD